VVLPMAPAAYPDFIQQRGSGTLVTFFGNKNGDNTFVPAGNAKGWLLRYLNTRFFRLSNDGIDVLVRVPAGDPDEWPHTPDEVREGMRGKGRSSNLTKSDGTAGIWDEAADRQGATFRGTVDVAGDPSVGIPPAGVHWWVLPSGAGTDVSSRTASGGSIAVLFD